jgi:drug/metabolite transporter (DMT)-like permease
MNLLSTYLLAFFAMACYAFMPVLLKRLQIEIPPLMLIAITMAVLCALAAGASFFFEKTPQILTINPKMWAGMVFFGVVNFIGFAVFMIVIAKIPVAHYQLIGLATPIVGAAFAYWMLGEEFKIQYLVGLVFIAIGLFIALRQTSS